MLILLLGDGILQEIYLWYKEASLKVTYYFYYNGSLVVECFFNSFAGSIIAARYNVCKFLSTTTLLLRVMSVWLMPGISSLSPCGLIDIQLIL